MVRNQANVHVSIAIVNYRYQQLSNDLQESVRPPPPTPRVAYLHEFAPSSTGATQQNQTTGNKNTSLGIGIPYFENVNKRCFTYTSI